jgi:hypothetical protein
MTTALNSKTHIASNESTDSAKKSVKRLPFYNTLLGIASFAGVIFSFIAFGVIFNKKTTGIEDIHVTNNLLKYSIVNVDSIELLIPVILTVIFLLIYTFSVRRNLNIEHFPSDENFFPTLGFTIVAAFAAAALFIFFFSVPSLEVTESTSVLSEPTSELITTNLGENVESIVISKTNTTLYQDANDVLYEIVETKKGNEVTLTLTKAKAGNLEDYLTSSEK